MNNMRVLAVILLVVIFIFTIAIYVACSEDNMEIIDIAWNRVDGADGYIVFVTTYYDRSDRSLSTTKKHEFEDVDTAAIPVRKTSDQIDTAVVNVCFQIASFVYDKNHNGKTISEISRPECLRPWPPQNVQIK